jgi:hypothetical protein
MIIAGRAVENSLRDTTEEQDTRMAWTHSTAKPARASYKRLSAGYPALGGNCCQAEQGIFLQGNSLAGCPKSRHRKT